jgi:hypothetical protein
MAILKNLEGAFVSVYEGQGIGGYDLKSASDRALAFDYDRSGKPDHLLLYRPGARIASILKNTGGTFSPVYEGYGIGAYDLVSDNDRAFAFDYRHTGKLDRGGRIRATDVATTREAAGPCRVRQTPNNSEAGTTEARKPAA